MPEPLTFATLTITVDDTRVGIVTMNRPDALNAMNTQMMQDLRDCFMHFYVEPDAAACLVLTGAGTRGFCTGADLKERKGMTDAVWRRQHAIVEQAVKAIMECPIPIIAAVNGAAYAGGMELALACDFVYAADHAKFALTEVTLGIMPGAAGTQNLPRAVGTRRAKEIILTGQPFTAADALAWGLANRVVPGDVLLRRSSGDRAPHRRQRADLGPPGQEIDRQGDRTRSIDRLCLRDRSLQPYGFDRGPPGRHQRLQRKA